MSDTREARVDFGQNIQAMHDLSITELYSIPLDKVAEIQLVALRKQFDLLSDKVATLGRLAEAQNLHRIDRLEDAAAILFPHSHYKSYSLSALETARFDRLTRWLGGLTTHDLSDVNTDVETIDDWIDALDAQTPIRVLHSSGTTGKLSFIPRSQVEIVNAVKGFRRVYSGFGDEPNNPLVGIEHCPIIIPTYRKGATGHARLLDALVEHLYGGDDTMAVALNAGRMSADMLSLSGRVRAAEAKGDVGRLQISATLLERREAFLAEQAEIPARRQAFFEDLGRRYNRRRVVVNGNWGMHYDVAVEARKKGLRDLFAPDSFMFVAGGLKGRDLPADYREVVREVYGINQIRPGYGMSEMFQQCPSCPKVHFHLPPYWIPYLLDPKTGEPFPRSGTHTGRFGFIDLMAETYWGGFLTGDEVTLNWGDIEPCGCGRLGPYLDQHIRRLSEKEGGDDKITCAGAPEAHDKALNFLTNLT